MQSLLSVVKSNLPKLIGLGFVGLFFWLSQQPSESVQELDKLASRFQFEKIDLPEITGKPFKHIRDVHPSLKHIEGMISFTGAAIAIGDLDNDGKPNDLVLVDPRTDQVTVMAAPQSGNRFTPFVLDPSPLPFKASTMAPMGSLLGDFNEDGLTDILVYYWGRSPILFLRKDHLTPPAIDQFKATELVEPFENWSTGAVTQADFDGDGHIDLIIGNYFPDNAKVLDKNGTGDETMPDSISRAFNGGKKRLFLWEKGASGLDPKASFRLVENALPPETVYQWTFGFAAVDLDGDLLPEIYCVHDWGADRLLHNRSTTGKPQFAITTGHKKISTPSSKVLGFDTFSGMGVDFGDLNNDGIPDLFVSNITANWGLHESNFAFLSTGELEKFKSGAAPYQDWSEELGLARSGWTWEARMGDFDNDGNLEVMQATGFLKGKINRWPELQEFSLGNDRVIHKPWSWPPMRDGDDVNGNDLNPFFVKGSKGRFFDIAEKLNLPRGTLSRGIATADIDGDGRLDFILANQWGPSYYFMNQSPKPGSFLGINLRIPIENQTNSKSKIAPGFPDPKTKSRPAIGAQVRLVLPDGKKLIGQVDGGTGHSGKRSQDLHFGLGELSRDKTLDLEIRWRDKNGTPQTELVQLKPGWHTIYLTKTGSVQGGNP